MFMMRNLSGPATMFEAEQKSTYTDVSRQASTATAYWQGETKQPTSACPTGFVMTEFGCATQPKSGSSFYDSVATCPTGTVLQNGLCYQVAPPPELPQLFVPQAPMPALPPPSSGPCPAGWFITATGCIDDSCAPGMVWTGSGCAEACPPGSVPNGRGGCDQQTAPGTTIYTPPVLPQFGSTLPKWALILAGGGTLLGLLALVLLRRR